MKTAVRICVTFVGGMFAAWWVLVPHRWQGRVVLELTETHGVHSHDVVGLTAAIVATAVTWLPWGRAISRR